MSDKQVTIKISLDDESKALLAANTKALMASTAAAGGKPAVKPGKAKTPPADDESFEESADDESEEGEGEGEGDESEEGDDDGEGEGEGDDGEGDDGDDTVTDLDTVGQALRAYAGAKGPSGAGSKALAMELLKKHGKVDGLSKLKPALFATVIAAAEAAVAALKKPKKPKAK